MATIWAADDATNNANSMSSSSSSDDDEIEGFQIISMDAAP